VIAWLVAHAEHIAGAALLGFLALYAVSNARLLVRRLLEDWRDEVKQHSDRWEELAPLAVERVQAALINVAGLLDRGARR
jgi:hypothetical protein